MWSNITFKCNFQNAKLMTMNIYENAHFKRNQRKYVQCNPIEIYTCTFMPCIHNSANDGYTLLKLLFVNVFLNFVELTTAINNLYMSHSLLNNTGYT